jgi:phenylpropionate dioxygenase-like ring-hydroxylating dioxygenase large terminal subunit
VSTEALLTGLPLLADDLSERDLRSFFLYHIYPNQLIVTMPDYVAWFRNQPVTPSLTKLQMFLLIRPNAREVPGSDEIIAELRDFFVKVNDEDIAANESQQLGLGSRVAAPGRFSHLEESLWHFAGFIRQGVATN